MTIAVSNVSLANTFGHWVTRTNELAQAMSNNAVTVGGSPAVGNAIVHGVFSANTIRIDTLSGFTGSNISLSAVNLVVSNTASLVSTGTLSINGPMLIGSVSTMKIQGANATHRTLAAIDANGTIGFIQVEFPLDQLTDVDTSNVPVKDNETILKWNSAANTWQANTLSLINSTRINTLNVGTITSVLTVSANANIGAGTLFVNRTNNRVGINTTSPSSALSVNGAITATGDISGFQTSDARFKENVYGIKGAVDFINSLRPVTFKWNDQVAASEYASPNNVGDDAGLIAQEVKLIYPEAVIERPDGTLAVNYVKLIPFLVSAIQELSKKIK